MTMTMTMTYLYTETRRHRVFLNSNLTPFQAPLRTPLLLKEGLEVVKQAVLGQGRLSSYKKPLCLRVSVYS